jgi:Rrf2 family iron-sulfur cluster assembly transcriptional regulator
MRLRLTKRADYAVRACLVLASASEVPLPSRCIAQRMAIPDRFLPQILADLSRAGIVEGTVGKGGGYVLRRDARELTLLDVIESVEGPSRSEQCVLEDRRCDADHACALHPVWSAAQSAFIHVLESTTLDRIATPDTHPTRLVGVPVGQTAPERIPA